MSRRGERGKRARVSTKGRASRSRSVGRAGRPGGSLPRAPAHASPTPRRSSASPAPLSARFLRRARAGRPSRTHSAGPTRSDGRNRPGATYCGRSRPRPWRLNWVTKRTFTHLISAPRNPLILLMSSRGKKILVLHPDATRKFSVPCWDCGSRNRALQGPIAFLIPRWTPYGHDHIPITSR